jgi:hypothetical protein
MVIRPCFFLLGRLGLSLGTFALLAAACGPDAGGGDLRFAGKKAAIVKRGLAAECTVEVVGVGTRDVETDYLPHVIACENGNADYEALKAQAVAARAYVYYKKGVGNGTVTDGTGDQVYTCSNSPGTIHYDAVAETAGQMLTYNDVIVAGFYVAGAIPGDRNDCVAEPGDDDYSDTEHFVTYNWGNAGAALVQTDLGWISPTNDANRGCKSQNGAHCLAEAGWAYQDILRFFYGMDIVIEQAEGACVADPCQGADCPFAPDEFLVVDNADETFSISGDFNESLSGGYDDVFVYADPAPGNAPDVTATFAALAPV